VEGDVHGGRVEVEGVPDGRAVGLEGEAGLDGGAAGRVLAAEDEVVAGLAALEGGGVPDGEAGRVAEPLVADFGGVADCEVGNNLAMCFSSKGYSLRACLQGFREMSTYACSASQPGYPCGYQLHSP